MAALLLAALPLSLLPPLTVAQEAVAERPWMNATLDPETRTRLLVAAMTEDEKLTLVLGFFGNDFPPKQFKPPAGARPASAGYVPGIPRLGIPPQWQTDAGLGVAYQGDPRTQRERTSLPSGMAIASTWNPDLARKGGEAIGQEARKSGFNVMLAGSVNLLRDPRNGRTFENAGEDPLLAGTMVGEQIAGIQANDIISTVKHFALNNQETGRKLGNFRISASAARQSDLLAFQFAMERGRPGSVMCAFNQVNQVYACENPWLLTDVLRGDWGFSGYVMSDWGGVHSTAAAANAGLEQQSGIPFDDEIYFGAPLKRAVATGDVPKDRLDEMVSRILRAMFRHGLFDKPVAEEPIDLVTHEGITQALIEEGAVLLKNAGDVLPLSGSADSIAVIGGHADKGVLSGGGSAQVYPKGGNAVPSAKPTEWPGPVIYHPSAPLKAIKALAGSATVAFAGGEDIAGAVDLARRSEVAVVFVTQWTGESEDTSVTLPDNQDALVAAVAAANPRTIVVLETGGPVLMPWIDQVAGALQLWYPGTRGGEAVANLLFGKTNPSGKLPATFPRSLDQLPRPGPIDPTGKREKAEVDVTYQEGAAVGYKWFDRQKLEPLFPFGHGLSYTRFALDDLKLAVRNNRIQASFRIRNVGGRAGKAIPQLYVAPDAGGWEAPKRLAGWAKVDLQPGATMRAQVAIDPRLLATYDERRRRWRIAGGKYRLVLAHSATDIVEAKEVTLKDETFADPKLDD